MEQAIRRELGCEPRKFKTVRGALLWMQDYKARQEAQSVPLEVGFSPTSREKRDMDRATFAFLLCCTQPADPGTDSFVLHHVGKLLDWTRAWKSQRDFAADWGFPNLHSLRLTMKFTLAVLEGRLDARSLLL